MVHCGKTHYVWTYLVIQLAALLAHTRAIMPVVIRCTAVSLLEFRTALCPQKVKPSVFAITFLKIFANFNQI